MSSNLIRRSFAGNATSQDEARVIDTNDLIAKKIQAFAKARKSARGESGEEGFVDGLFAEELDVAQEISEESAVVKAESVDTEALLAEAREEAARIVENARKQSEIIVAEAKEQAELVKNNILEEARKNGYRDGIDRAKAETDEALSALQDKEKALVKEFEERYEQLLENMEPQLVECITSIYEHIFNVELQSNRDILLYLISSTLRKVEGTKEFLVHVSKEDYPFVNMQKKQLQSCMLSENCKLEIVEDLLVNKNECLIETDGGIFDCGLGTQLSELNQKLKVLSYTK